MSNNNGDDECSSTISVKAGLWFKPIGLVPKSADTWHCAAFISPRPCNDDGSCYSALETVGVIIIIIIMKHDSLSHTQSVLLYPAQCLLTTSHVIQSMEASLLTLAPRWSHDPHRRH